MFFQHQINFSFVLLFFGFAGPVFVVVGLVPLGVNKPNVRCVYLGSTVFEFDQCSSANSSESDIPIKKGERKKRRG